MNRELKELFKVRHNVVYSVTGDTTIKEAVDKMNIHHVGALMVVSENDEVEGILTERDVMIKLAATDELVGHLPVKELMTPKENLVVISGDEKLGEIMKIMTERHVRHLPIVDEFGTLHGVISIRNVLSMLLKKTKIESEDLKHYIAGNYPG